MIRPKAPAPPSLPCGIVDLLDPSQIERHFREQQEPVRAIPTPLPSLNAECGDNGGGVGLGEDWHVTASAATGTGKTNWGINSGTAAIQHGVSVGYVSLEMSLPQIATRTYAIIADAYIRRLERRKEFSPDTARRVATRIAEIRERTGARFYVNERPIFDIDSVTGLMRYWHEQHGVQFFVVDYLQLAAARDAQTLFANTVNVSCRVREFAKTFGCITLGLSQFNRETSANYSEKPRIQGLMGGSPLENDSDLVLLFDHSRYRKSGDHARTWALVGKNRHGRQLEIPVEWDYRTLRIREARRDEEDDWP